MKKKIFIGTVGLVIFLSIHFTTAKSENNLLFENIEAFAKNESQGVEKVQQGTMVEYDDQGNTKIVHFCNCIGEGKLDCPC